MKNNNQLSSKMFKTIVTTTMVTSAITAATPTVINANNESEVFNDVKKSSDYYGNVTELFERSFVNGYNDGSFKPNASLTRAHAAKILALNLGLDVTENVDYTFQDLSREHWAYPYIVALKKAGIIDGYPDGTFKPNEPLTRNQMAKIIVNGYGLEPTSTITLPFVDIQANSWAAPYIQTLFNLGITLGQNETTYGGNSTVTRANMAAFTIRSEVTVDYRKNRKTDENIISSINGNQLVMDNQIYYIAKELQPLLHARNLAVLNEAKLDFIKIGTKIVGIRNIELLNIGTAESPLIVDLAGSTVEANITITGDYIKLVNANITGDITIKKGDQKLIELNGLDLNGRLIVEGEAKREQESVIKLTNTTVDEIVVNRDETKIITDNATPTIKVGSNVSEMEVAGKIKNIDFNGNQDVLLKGTLQTEALTIETPIKVTLENKTKLPLVETQQYGSQLILPKDSSIDTFIKPNNVKVEEAVKLLTGGLPTIGNMTDTSNVVRPTTPPPSSTGGGVNGGYYDPFVSQILTTNNVIDADKKDPLAVGMIGTTVTTSNPNVATAKLVDGKIMITSTGFGSAVITVKEDAPSVKEAQITVTVDETGKISHTIRRPAEVALDKINANPALGTADLLKLYEAAELKGITPINIGDVAAAVQKAITDKGKHLTKEELKLAVDIALLPEQIKKDNPSTEKVSTQLDLQVKGPNGTIFIWKPVLAVDGASVDELTGNVTRSANDNTNDTVALGITATNGITTKDATIAATILEAKPPYLVSVTVNDKDQSKVISAGDDVTLLFSENLSEADHVKALDDMFGTNHPYGNNATLVWTDNKTAVITLGTNPTLQFGTTLEPIVTDVQGNPYKNSGNTVWQSSTFQPQTNKDTDNLRDPLGIKGKSVSTNNPNVATAAIIAGKVEITSVGAPGKATITVLNGNDQAEIDVIVGLDGSVIIDNIKPFNGDVKLDILILDTVPQASQGTWAEALLGAGSTATGGPYNEDFPYIGNGQFLEAERFMKNGVYGGPEFNDSAFTFKVASAKNQANDLDTTNFMKLLNASNPITGEGIYRVHINEDGQSMNSTYFVDVFGKVGTNFADYYQQFSYTTFGNNVTSVITARHNGSELQVVWDFKDLANIATQDIYLLKGDVWNQNDAPSLTPIGTVDGKTFEWQGAVDIDSDGNAISANQDYTVVVVKKNAAGQAIAYDGFNHYAINTKVAKMAAANTTAIDTIANNLTDTVIQNQNSSLQEVKTALSLPTIFEGANITWSATTENGATIDPATGAVTRSDRDDLDDVVTMTANIELNGLTKTKTFQVTVKESKAPTVISATLQDLDSDGNVSTGDSIELTFSEPVNGIGNVTIGSHSINPQTGTWSLDKTKLTITTSGSVSSNDTATIQVENIVDVNSNMNPLSQVNITTVPITPLPFVATILQSNFSGDYYYNSNNKISSEAVDGLEDALKNLIVMQGIHTVTPTNIRYDNDNVASGSVASGKFTLNSIKAIINGQEQTIALENNIPITVTTSNILKVKNATEVINGVISTEVSNGLVKTVTVDDSVMGIIDASTSTLNLSKSVTLIGEGKLKVGAISITAPEITLDGLEATNSHGSGFRSAIKIGGAASVINFNNVNVNHIRGGGYTYAALNIERDGVELNIKNSNIIGQYEYGGNNTNQPAYGIYTLNQNVKISIENSRIAGLHVKPNDLRGASGIYVGENATLEIKGSTIEAYGGGNYTTAIQGIRIGAGSNLTITNNSTVKVTALDGKEAYGIFKEGTVNLSYAGTIFNLFAEPGKQTLEVN